MQGYCTCGAKLAEDSLFCHRCGRPLRADLIEAENARTQPDPDPEPVDAATLPADSYVPAPPPDVNFHNGPAVRSALLAGAQAVLISFPAMLILGPLTQIVVPVAAGLYSTFLYRRRTGAELTPPSSIRLGWMTGVFAFVITTVLLTFAFVMLTTNDDLMRELRQNAGPVKLPPETLESFQKIQQHPELMLLSLAGNFLFSTLLCALGGWLGSRFRTASPPPPPQK